MLSPTVSLYLHNDLAKISFQPFTPFQGKAIFLDTLLNVPKATPLRKAVRYRAGIPGVSDPRALVRSPKHLCPGHRVSAHQ